MPASVTACPTCNAAVTAESAKFCRYCGTALPQLPEAAPLVGEARNRARFAALREHPRLAGLLQRSPSAAGVTTSYGCLAGFGVIFTTISLFITFGFAGAVSSSGFGGPSAVVVIFPLLFVAIGIGVIVSGLRNASKVATAPTERIPVRIADERIQVSGGGKRTSASTKYFVTVEDEDGRRTEYQTTAEVAAAAAPDDVGIAYVKAFLLLDFQRLRV